MGLQYLLLYAELRDENSTTKKVVEYLPAFITCGCTILVSRYLLRH